VVRRHGDVGLTPPSLGLLSCRFARRPVQLERSAAFVEQCLADYDLDGWTSGIWTSET